MNLADAHYVFVTANQTLSKVASEYHRTTGRPDKSIPSTISDTFLGTYIWLCDPIKIIEMNEKQMLSQAFLAFQPSIILLQKLTTTVNELRKKDSISADLCYTLKGDKLVLEKLAEKTLGDPDAYLETTCTSIIMEIESEAEQRGTAKEKALRDQREEELKEGYQTNLTIKEKKNK